MRARPPDPAHVDAVECQDVRRYVEAHRAIRSLNRGHRPRMRASNATQRHGLHLSRFLRRLVRRNDVRFPRVREPLGVGDGRGDGRRHPHRRPVRDELDCQFILTGRVWGPARGHPELRRRLHRDDATSLVPPLSSTAPSSRSPPFFSARGAASEQERPATPCCGEALARRSRSGAGASSDLSQRKVSVPELDGRLRDRQPRHVLLKPLSSSSMGRRPPSPSGTRMGGSHVGWTHCPAPLQYWSPLQVPQL
jgi:hypothetical protein